MSVFIAVPSVAIFKYNVSCAILKFNFFVADSIFV